VGYLFLSALPALILVVNYISRKNWHKGENTETISRMLSHLSTLEMLKLMNNSEHPVKNTVVILLLSLFIFAVFLRLKKLAWQPGDAWLLFTAVALAFYFTQVGNQSLEMLMPMRLQLFPWLGLFFWSASATYPAFSRSLFSIGALVILLGLLSVRLPAHRKASRLVSDWVSLGSLVADRSVLMVLNYDFNGTDENGKMIGDAIWMFNHATDYIGANRSGVIMSDNYEGLLGYFPLKWRLEGDLYNRTAIDGIGFEDRPPKVDLLGFPKRSQGRQIDYVLVVGRKPSDLEHERGKEIQIQLDSAYNKIAVSPEKQAELYKLRSR
jgi:hypothetical protein